MNLGNNFMFLLSAAWKRKKNTYFRDFHHDASDLKNLSKGADQRSKRWFSLDSRRCVMWCNIGFSSMQENLGFFRCLAVKVQLSRRRCIPVRDSSEIETFIDRMSKGYDSQLEDTRCLKKNTIFQHTKIQTISLHSAPTKKPVSNVHLITFVIVDGGDQGNMTILRSGEEDSMNFWFNSKFHCRPPRWYVFVQCPLTCRRPKRRR